MIDKLKSLIEIMVVIILVAVNVLIACFSCVMFFASISIKKSDINPLIANFPIWGMILYVAYSLHLGSIYIGLDMLKMNNAADRIRQRYTKILKFSPILFITSAFIQVYSKTIVDYEPALLCFASGIVLFRHKINIYFRYLGAFLSITSVVLWFTKGHNIDIDIQNISTYAIVISIWLYMSYFQRTDLLKTFLYIAVVLTLLMPIFLMMFHGNFKIMQYIIFFLVSVVVFLLKHFRFSRYIVQRSVSFFNNAPLQKANENQTFVVQHKTPDTTSGPYIVFFILFAMIIFQGAVQDKALRAKGKKDNSIPQVQQQQSQVVCKQGSGAGCSATCYKMYNDCIAQGGGAESCAQSIANIIPANAKPSSNCICPTCNNTWNKRW